MKTFVYIVSLVALSVSVLTGCNAVGCTENQNSVPLAGFYSMTTGEAISIDSLAIGGSDAPDDSLLVAPSEQVSEVYLPLRSTATATTFVIKYMQRQLAAVGAEDRITFYYESKPWFASEDCGAMYHYRITRVAHTTQLLDSIGISDSLVTNIELQTIRLYFRTADPDDPDEPLDEDNAGDGDEEDTDASDDADVPAPEVARHA